MARSANTTSDTFVVPEGATDVKRNKEGVVIEFRLPDASAYKGGVMQARVKDQKTGQLVVREKVYSISAGVSERYNDVIDAAIDAFINTDSKEKGMWDEAKETHTSEYEVPTRAQFIRMVVAEDERIAYDLALEPAKDPKGAGLVEHRRRQNEKLSSYDAIVALSKERPELLAILRENGIEVPEEDN